MRTRHRYVKLGTYNVPPHQLAKPVETARLESSPQVPIPVRGIFIGPMTGFEIKHLFAYVQFGASCVFM